MSPAVRRFVLAVHLALAIGWIGALAAYIALDATAVISADGSLIRASYAAMDLIVRYVIVPLALGAVISGVVISVGTKWGLFRHWWVVISLLLTLFATVVLLLETSTVSGLAAIAAEPGTSTEQLRGLGGTLVHSVGGTVVLLIVLVLNVYKPRGLTPYGWRKQQEERP
jgi:hypothetical protein